MLHYYGNKYHRVPKEWRFPRCGAHDLWRQWWVGDSLQNIPPLVYIEYEDVKHLNLLPPSKFEKIRKPGPKKKTTDG
jgi:ribosomal protein L32E